MSILVDIHVLEEFNVYALVKNLKERLSEYGDVTITNPKIEVDTTVRFKVIQPVPIAKVIEAFKAESEEFYTNVRAQEIIPWKQAD